MREIRLHGSEGGAVQANAPFLPLSVGLQTHMDLLRCGRQTPPWKAALPWGFNAYIGSSPLRVCALFSHFPKNDEKSLIDTPLRKANAAMEDGATVGLQTHILDLLRCGYVHYSLISPKMTKNPRLIRRCGRRRYRGASTHILDLLRCGYVHYSLISPKMMKNP